MPPRKRQKTEQDATPEQGDGPRRSKRQRSDPQRKDRNPASRSAPDGPNGEDTSRSVLGGMAGGFRVTGDEEQSNEDGITSFKVPFEDKGIVCQLYSQLSTNDHNNDDKSNRTAAQTFRQAPRLIFTHGAGGGLANPATADFSRGFAQRDPVLCFQGTMNLQSRVKTFKAVTEHIQAEMVQQKDAPLALGGRSMGARAACIATRELKNIDALVLVSYPLTSEKGNDTREQPLLDLPENLKVLFVSGSEDKMCDLKHLSQVRAKMKAKSWLLEAKGADHGMSMKGGKSVVESMRKKTGAVIARWLQDQPEKDDTLDPSDKPNLDDK